MKKYIAALCVVGLLSSCNDYAVLEKNPNLPTSVPAELTLRTVLSNMNEGAWNDAMRSNQFYCSNYNYYSSNEYNWSAASLQFTTLKNVIKMEEEAIRSGAKAVNPYAAVGKFLRAYYYTKMTLAVGDLPVKDALKGLTVDQPTYDTQKDVFVQVLKWLEDANADLAPDGARPAGCRGTADRGARSGGFARRGGGADCGKGRGGGGCPAGGGGGGPDGGGCRIGRG